MQVSKQFKALIFALSLFTVSNQKCSAVEWNPSSWFAPTVSQYCYNMTLNATPSRLIRHHLSEISSIIWAMPYGQSAVITGGTVLAGLLVYKVIYRGILRAAYKYYKHEHPRQLIREINRVFSTHTPKAAAASKVVQSVIKANDENKDLINAANTTVASIRANAQASGIGGSSSEVTAAQAISDAITRTHGLDNANNNAIIQAAKDAAQEFEVSGPTYELPKGAVMTKAQKAQRFNELFNELQKYYSDWL